MKRSKKAKPKPVPQSQEPEAYQCPHIALTLVNKLMCGTLFYMCETCNSTFNTRLELV